MLSESSAAGAEERVVGAAGGLDVIVHRAAHLLFGVTETFSRKEVLRALASAQAKMLEKSEWVGRSFATRARAMHAGEEDHATIHGQATPAEARALADEGVPVAPLPLPVPPPETLN